MEIYQVMHGPALIPAGTKLQLSDAQVKPRKQQLRRLESGWFIALADLTFKTGDVLTFYQPLENSLLAPFMPPEMQRPVLKHPNYRPPAKKG